MDVEPAAVDESIGELVGDLVGKVVGEEVDKVVGEEFDVSVEIVSVSERIVVWVVAILASFVTVVPSVPVVCVIWFVVKLD